MKQRSIAFHVSLWSAATIAFSMGLYGVYQYFTMPEMTVRTLVVKHMLHVVVLGVVIYLVMAVALNRLVVRPLRQISYYFYKAGRGEGRWTPIKTPVKELADIYAWGSTARRVQAYQGSGKLRQIFQYASEIKQAAGSLAADDSDAIARLSQLAGQLQHEAADLMLSLSAEAGMAFQQTDK